MSPTSDEPLDNALDQALAQKVLGDALSLTVWRWW